MKSFAEYSRKARAALLIVAFVAAESGQFAAFPGIAHAGSPTTILITSGTTWTVPSDWNSSDNTIEVIGGGGGSAYGGGGGGAYSEATDVSLTPGATVDINVGMAGTSSTSSPSVGGDTYVCNSTSNCASITGTAVVAGAKGGGAGGVTYNPNTGIIAGGARGAASSGVGSTKYSGGAGGEGMYDSSYPAYIGSGGGGGAGGPGGAGGAGGSDTINDGVSGGGGGSGGGSNGQDGSSDGSTYYDGGNGGTNAAGTGAGNGAIYTGSSNTPATAGSSGGGGGGGVESSGEAGAGSMDSEWTDNSGGANNGMSAGPGGGGGGGNLEDSDLVFDDLAGGNGGGYGSGAGGMTNYAAYVVEFLSFGYSYTSGTPASSQPGIIAITYTPLSSPAVDTNAASAVAATSATANGDIASIGAGDATVRGVAWSTDSALSSGVSTTSESGSFGTGAFTASLSGLSANTTYYYRAYATNSTAPGYGSIVSFTTLPGTPGTPSLSAITSTSTSVSWSAPTGGVSSYTLQWCAGATCGSSSGISGTSAAASGLTGNTSYGFTVAGVNGTGTGAYSATTTQLLLPNAPGTPSFGDITQTTVTVSWTAPTGGASSYKLERCEGSGCTDFVEIESGITGTSFDDSGLSQAGVYRYRVRATNATGDSLYSGIGRVTMEQKPSDTVRIIRLMGVRLVGHVRLQ